MFIFHLLLTKGLQAHWGEEAFKKTTRRTTTEEENLDEDEEEKPKKKKKKKQCGVKTIAVVLGVLSSILGVGGISGLVVAVLVLSKRRRFTSKLNFVPKNDDDNDIAEKGPKDESKSSYEIRVENIHENLTSKHIGTDKALTAKKIKSSDIDINDDIGSIGRNEPRSRHSKLGTSKSKPSKIGSSKSRPGKIGTSRSDSSNIRPSKSRPSKSKSGVNKSPNVNIKIKPPSPVAKKKSSVISESSSNWSSSWTTSTSRSSRSTTSSSSWDSSDTSDSERQPLLLPSPRSVQNINNAYSKKAPVFN